MENAREYRLISGKHSRREDGRRVRYRPGDVFVPTNAEIRKLGKRLESVETKDGAKDAVIETGQPVTEQPAKAAAITRTSAGSPQESEKQHVIKHVGGGWYDLPGGRRVRGKENAARELAKMLEEDEKK